MKHLRIRRSAAALLSVLALLVIGGLAASQARARHAPAALPAIGQVPQLAEVGDRALPVEEYLLSPEQHRTVAIARNTLITRCLARFDVRIDLPPVTGVAQRQTVRRYGVADAALAAAHGYHAHDGVLQSKPTAPALTADEQTALGGASGSPSASPAAQSVHGIPVPAGGCTGEAARELTVGGRDGTDANAAEGLNFGTYQQSMKDPRVQSVFHAWSACMKSHGYDYPNPMAAISDPHWGGADATPAEIATASADVACKQQTNLIGVWFTVESAYQTRFIQQQLAEYTDIKKDNDAILTIAQSVINGQR